MELRLLTVPEAAERLGVSRRQFDRYKKAGRIRFVRLGPRLIRVRSDDLDAFIRRCEQMKSAR